ncbi:MAG: penicillin-binding protein 1A [Gammaproteobacteria bacterium]|nr:PBP1A family penicillin-binding protein [Gammaproteobacteria bacterium]NIO61741.1 PBP1A family penicillin-binding protein [Gammaproteobacteria bacterium]NIP48611.1 penicillin-binding protein 1A [Gammaproteobacteria bacterium]NIQ09063.1 penicillin-binding protein 1A [Gammaproteobacteria bacterium]NIQ18992.1 PBP1A family penicillin-binding protein [Gammaproteobacteria bacterium]
MLRFSFYFLLVSLLSGIVLVVALALFIVPQLPDIETLKDIRMQVPLRVYSADQSLIAEFGEQRRIPITREEIPEQMIQAILAAEDDRFYVHPGVDWQGILRAAIQLVKTGEKTQGGSTITMQVARNFFLTREKTYLRKLNEIFLALKIEKELSKDEILTLYLNKIYLGQRAYGVGAAAQVYYGLQIHELSLPQFAMLAALPKAPSTTNPVSNLDRATTRRNYVLQRMLNEEFITEEEYKDAVNTPVSAALHSSLVQLEAPYIAEMVRQYLVDEYGEEAYTSGLHVTTTIRDGNQRSANAALRKGILAYDQRHGYRGAEHHFDLDEDIDESGWGDLLASFPILGELYPALVIDISNENATAYVLNIGKVEVAMSGMTWARKYVSENIAGPEPKKPDDILNVGDVVRLTETDDSQWILSQLPDVESCLVSFNPEDGATIALVGGFDFLRSKFNRVTQAYRQPGSGFKPFIYSAAIDSGMTAATIINDAPVVFEDRELDETWRPENYSQKTYGPTRLRVALTHSRNLVSIRLLNEIGIPFALDYISRFGFDTSRLPANLSLALGSGAVTPWQLARGYAVFANGGYLIEPYFIQKIVSQDGKILYEANPAIICPDCPEPVSLDSMQGIGETTPEEDPETNPEQLGEDSETDLEQEKEESVEPRYAKRVLESENVWIMNSMTRDVIQHGTGRRALVLARKDLSGKTGTTNDQRDAWFSGFNSDVVTVTWIGFDKFQPLGNAETGARAALPIWIDYMATALKGLPEKLMERPPGLVFARIDPVSGKLASPESTDAIFEVFRSGKVPEKVSSTGPTDINQATEGPAIQDLF